MHRALLLLREVSENDNEKIAEMLPSEQSESSKMNLVLGLKTEI